MSSGSFKDFTLKLFVYESYKYISLFNIYVISLFDIYMKHYFN